jgi:phosphoglycerate dehydrogenase-like enzyme/aminoglycoside phosphotransferase (APT) family kinase protein
MENKRERPVVVLTDHPWEDLDIEEQIFADASIDLVAGPTTASPSTAIEKLVIDSNPNAILTCFATVSATAIQAPDKLALVARLGIGLDNIDVEAATERGAWVTNVPDYCVAEVSDHALAFVLGHMRGVIKFDRTAKRGEWAPGQLELRRLSDLVVGLVGYGRIGKETGRKLRALGCRVLANSRTLREAENGVEVASLGTIQEKCDVIILHAPLTDQTHHLVDAPFLANCRRSPLIVNLSRGGLVDNDALLQALDNSEITGAALDVIEGEPTPPLELLRHNRTIVTPHISYSSDTSLLELRRRACEEVVRVLHGELPHFPCNEPARILDGGVSSDIRIIETPDGPQVVKQALTKLRVHADWFADADRSSTEAAALRTGRNLLGANTVPAVLWEDRDQHTFAMEFIGLPFESWKERLLRGQVDVQAASAAGRILGALHHCSRDRQDVREEFQDQTYFEQLRIDPFFRRTGETCPEHASGLMRIAEGMSNRRTALVHGDYSPKNLLTDGQRIVVLDWECAHWGDPRFDIAFCLSHLILKSFHADLDSGSAIACADAFSTAYRQTNPGFWDIPLVEITGALLMARICGVSPIDYLERLDVDAVRQLAASYLHGAPDLAGRPLFENLENISDTENK